MKIQKLRLTNYTVFENAALDFDSGVNIFIGENGTGKTHIMKLLYSACQAANPMVAFQHKIVKTMLPDNYNISRLITRSGGNSTAKVAITALSSKSQASKNLSIEFSRKTRKWEAVVKGEKTWEKEFDRISSVFIPAKEILSNSYNLISAVEKNNIHFDDTYIDIINSAKIDITVGRNSAEKHKRLERIEEIINGKVEYNSKNDEFYLKKGNTRQEFNLVAEGIRKMALLWQLVKNGTLEKDSVLFWDEPEANINPKYISVIVELLLELQRDGVQIFVSTHDYMLAKYFEIKKQSGDVVKYHSFNLDKKGVTVESSETFGRMKNVIVDSFEKLMDEVYSTEVK